MLRPEQILCQGAGHAADPEAPRGRVLSTSFYGHDATARIALDGPDRREIVARAVGHLLPHAGDEVAIAVVGTALAYPARPTASEGAPPSAFRRCASGWRSPSSAGSRGGRPARVGRRGASARRGREGSRG